MVDNFVYGSVPDSQFWSQSGGSWTLQNWQISVAGTASPVDCSGNYVYGGLYQNLYPYFILISSQSPSGVWYLARNAASVGPGTGWAISDIKPGNAGQASYLWYLTTTNTTPQGSYTPDGTPTKAKYASSGTPVASYVPDIVVSPLGADAIGSVGGLLLAPGPNATLDCTLEVPQGDPMVIASVNVTGNNGDKARLYANDKQQYAELTFSPANQAGYLRVYNADGTCIGSVELTSQISYQVFGGGIYYRSIPFACQGSFIKLTACQGYKGTTFAAWYNPIYADVTNKPVFVGGSGRASPSPNVSGIYAPTSERANGQIVYFSGSNYLWYDGTQWVIGYQSSTTAAFVNQTAGTAAGPYYAAGAPQTANYIPAGGGAVAVHADPVQGNLLLIISSPVLLGAVETKTIANSSLISLGTGDTASGVQFANFRVTQQLGSNANCPDCDWKCIYGFVGSGLQTVAYYEDPGCHIGTELPSSDWQIDSGTWSIGSISDSSGNVMYGLQEASNSGTIEYLPDCPDPEGFGVRIAFVGYGDCRLTFDGGAIYATISIVDTGSGVRCQAFGYPGPAPSPGCTGYFFQAGVYNGTLYFTQTNSNSPSGTWYLSYDGTNIGGGAGWTISDITPGSSSPTYVWYFASTNKLSAAGSFVHYYGSTGTATVTGPTLGALAKLFRQDGTQIGTSASAFCTNSFGTAALPWVMLYIYFMQGTVKAGLAQVVNGVCYATGNGTAFATAAYSYSGNSRVSIQVNQPPSGVAYPPSVIACWEARQSKTAGPHQLCGSSFFHSPAPSLLSAKEPGAREVDATEIERRKSICLSPCEESRLAAGVFAYCELDGIDPETQARCENRACRIWGERILGILPPCPKGKWK